MIPVEGHKGLYRDEKTNAILNCNETEYNDYIRIKDSIMDEKSELDALKKEIEDIKILLKSSFGGNT
jgi:hypothetical protein